MIFVNYCKAATLAKFIENLSRSVPKSSQNNSPIEQKSENLVSKRETMGLDAPNVPKRAQEVPQERKMNQHEAIWGSKTKNNPSSTGYTNPSLYSVRSVTWAVTCSNYPYKLKVLLNTKSLDPTCVRVREPPRIGTVREGKRDDAGVPVAKCEAAEDTQNAQETTM